MAFRVGNASDVKGLPSDFPRCGNWPGFQTCSAEACEKIPSNTSSTIISRHAIWGFVSLLIRFILIN